MRESVLHDSIHTAVQTSRQLTILILGVFAVALAIRLLCFTGLIGSDDLGYSGLAQQIADGSYQLEAHHYAIRYGVIVPVGILYRVFGVSEWTTVLLPLLALSFAVALTALVAARLAGLSAAWGAGLLMASLPVDVRYASILVPEPCLQFAVLAGALLVLYADERNSILLGVAAGAAFGAAYLTKEPGIFVGAAFGLFALMRQRWRLAFSLLAGVVIVVACEMIWYWSQNGDPLFRLHAMGSHNKSPMAVSANRYLWYRLLVAYPRMMLVPSIHLGLHTLLCLGLAICAVWTGLRDRKVQLLLLWAALPFLYLNFGTPSCERFWALPLAPRYICIVFPPLAILAATTAVRWAGHRSGRKRLLSVCVSVVAAVGIVCAVRTRGVGYRAEACGRLGEIADLSRIQNRKVVSFSGPEGELWRQAFQIVASDRLGQAGDSGYQVEPDVDGMPVVRAVVDR